MASYPASRKSSRQINRSSSSASTRSRSEKSFFSEGYGGNIHMHTAAAISHATKSSMQKSTRRISWGISRKNGINISLEDLRRRSTKIVVMGYENVGKTGNFQTNLV
jgi:hypothetical protein